MAYMKYYDHFLASVVKRQAAVERTHVATPPFTFSLFVQKSLP